MSITAIEVDQVAASVAQPRDHLLASAFRARAAVDDPNDPWRLLADVFEIHLRHSNPKEPFGPMIVMDGRRSMAPSDLSDEQLALRRELLPAFFTTSVRCRIGDVLWTACHDRSAAEEAVPAYIAAGMALEDANVWPPSMERYERAIRLARSLGRNHPLLTTALQHPADRVAHYKGEDTSLFTARALTLLEEFRFGDAAVLSGYALTGAERRNTAGDPYSARTYWDVAAKLHARAGLAGKAEQARIESARTWVAEADQKEASGNYGAAQSHLENAIQAYRAIPSCKHLLPQLHRRLDAAGAEVLKLMKPISSDAIDIGPVVQAAQKSVQGLPMSEAVYAFASAARTLDPDRLRTQVAEMAKKAPLSSVL